jgi:hypothetical protein
MSDLAGIVTTIVAVAALVLSIVNYIEARETRIRWRVDRIIRPDGASNAVILVNESQKFAAEVLSISDPDALDETNRIRVDAHFPLNIEPGNGIELTAWQFLGDVRTRISVTWRQRREGSKWTRPIRRTVVLYR